MIKKGGLKPGDRRRGIANAPPTLAVLELPFRPSGLQPHSPVVLRGFVMRHFRPTPPSAFPHPTSPLTRAFVAKNRVSRQKSRHHRASSIPTSLPFPVARPQSCHHAPTIGQNSPIWDTTSPLTDKTPTVMDKTFPRFGPITINKSPKKPASARSRPIVIPPSSVPAAPVSVVRFPPADLRRPRWRPGRFAPRPAKRLSPRSKSPIMRDSRQLAGHRQGGLPPCRTS
jgi:hypothetical protein